VKATRITSRVTTPQVNTIPKAENRFKLPSKNKTLINLESIYNSPGPGYYSTIDCFTHSPAQTLKMNGRPAKQHENR
jgi:hypothetical protein